MWIQPNIKPKGEPFEVMLAVMFELKAFEFPMAFLNEFKSILTFVNALL